MKSESDRIPQVRVLPVPWREGTDADAFAKRLETQTNDELRRLDGLSTTTATLTLGQVTPISNPRTGDAVVVINYQITRNLAVGPTEIETVRGDTQSLGSRELATAR